MTITSWMRPQRGPGSPKPRRGLCGEGGFTIIEMMIAAAIMIGVTGAVFHLLNPAQGSFQAQPEVSDMQQRLRVAVDSLARDLIMAGAGSYMGASNGSLTNYFAPIMPFRKGPSFDPSLEGTYKPDAITILYVPPTPAQTTVIKAAGNNSQELVVEPQMNCGRDKQDQLCGFEDGMRVLIFDEDGSWDTTTLTNIQDAALHLQHSGKLSSTYSSGNAKISQVATHTYYLKADNDKKTYELRHYDGYKTDLPVVDNVVGLQFEYFGDPLPPRLLPNKPLTDSIGPWTTYGPKPPALASDHPSKEWPTGENCVFKVEAMQHAPRLATVPTPTGVAQVKLDRAMLDGSDGGPWCPYPTSSSRFDADLLRVRRVRVTLRVQVGQAGLRGTDPTGLLFKYGGTAVGGERFVPDQEISFDITPRNMNLGR